MQALSKFFLHSSLSKIFGEFLESAKNLKGKKKTLSPRTTFHLRMRSSAFTLGFLLAKLASLLIAKLMVELRDFTKGD